MVRGNDARFVVDSATGQAEPFRHLPGQQGSVQGARAMVRIRATCPQCDHDVELTSDDVTAFVCADTNEGSYAFRCPDCDVAVSVEADARIIELLVDRGVDKRVWHLPAELAETKHGERLQYDDLLDLH